MPSGANVAQLVRLSAGDYVDRVLPHSHELWGGGRSFASYAHDLRDLAASRYGERRFSLYGLRHGDEIVASLKRYDRDLRHGTREYRCAGIGAVFVRPDRRGERFGSTLLRDLLRAERERGTDFAFLFSDIGPAMYERLGFEALPSRIFAARTRSLRSGDVAPEKFTLAHWQPLARCHAAWAAESGYPWLKRTPIVWDWFAQRLGGVSAAVRLRVMRGSRCLAFVNGRRANDSDTFVVDDCGAEPAQGAELLQPLIRHAAGSLANVRGWLPPPGIRALLPQGSVKRRTQALSMIAPLSPQAQRMWKSFREQALRADGDLFWWLDHV